MGREEEGGRRRKGKEEGGESGEEVWSAPRHHLEFLCRDRLCCLPLNELSSFNFPEILFLSSVFFPGF